MTELFSKTDTPVGADPLFGAIADATSLARIGLTLTKASRIRRQLTFETPIRLSDTVLLGVE